MDKITEFLVKLEPWLSLALFVLFAIALTLMIVFIVKYSKKKAYTKTLLSSIDRLEKKSTALESQVKVCASEKQALSDEVAEYKANKHISEEQIEDLKKSLEEKEVALCALKNDLNATKAQLSVSEEKLSKGISLEEYKKVSDELEKNKRKSIKVDTLISKVEELTKKTKPVIKKIKETVKVKKYSLDDLKEMYKHELMTLATELKLIGWTRYSKEKLTQFIYDNLPKNQKK